MDIYGNWKTRRADLFDEIPPDELLNQMGAQILNAEILKSDIESGYDNSFYISATIGMNRIADITVNEIRNVSEGRFYLSNESGLDGETYALIDKSVALEGLNYSDVIQVIDDQQKQEEIIKKIFDIVFIPAIKELYPYAANLATCVWAFTNEFWPERNIELVLPLIKKVRFEKTGDRMSFFSMG